MRAGQGERIRDQFERMAQVDDVDQLAGVEHLLQFHGFETGGAEFPEEALTPVDPGGEEAENAQNQERSAETTQPIEQAGVFFDEVAEDAAAQEQRTGPSDRANGIK